MIEGGRVFKTLARGEAAYAAILVAEEVLDVMQRDWMRDERVAPFARTINNIHVVEEARHMRFAREETRERLQGAGAARRQFNALVVAFAGFFIVTSMWNGKVYENAGLDPKRAKREAKRNQNHRALLRSSCAGPDGVPRLRGPAHRAGQGDLPRRARPLEREGPGMPYAITQLCCTDASCVTACPVNCIHPTPDEPDFGTTDMLYVDPRTCIDCGACAEVCPVDAVHPVESLTGALADYPAINAEYFAGTEPAGPPEGSPLFHDWGPRAVRPRAAGRLPGARRRGGRQRARRDVHGAGPAPAHHGPRHALRPAPGRGWPRAVRGGARPPGHQAHR